MIGGEAQARASQGGGAAPRVRRLILQDFRTYPALDLAVSRPLVALSGENGVGKTNLLEGLSLFAQAAACSSGTRRFEARSG